MATGDTVLKGINEATVENYQEFTATGTWTKPTGVKAVYVKAVGAGGGGGGGTGRKEYSLYTNEI